MEAGFIVSTEHFPIVLTIYPARMTMDAMPAYHAAYERVLAEGRPFVSLVDMRPCQEMPGADVRKSMVDWGEKVASERERLTLAVAFVVTHPLVRGALAAVHWQTPPRQPMVVVETPEQGIAALLERLTALGLAPPSTLEALRATLAATGA